MNKFSLSPDVKSKISLLLEREIPQSEQGSAQAFSDFNEKDLAEFRLLEDNSGVLAVSYIKFRLGEIFDLNTVVAFYSAVVQQKISIEEWMTTR